MLISRTPMRVSLFGGGTDYPEYFRQKAGAVVGFAIDKYIYINAINLHAFVDYRYRIAYSKVELVDDLAKIEHPVVKSVLETYDCRQPMDITVQQDLPAASGLGSSSTFTVGFLKIVFAQKGIKCSKLELARHAIHIERDVLKEHVGVQDQLHASFGGFHRYDFLGDSITSSRLPFEEVNGNDLTDWLILVHTGRKRRATNVIDEQLKRTTEKVIDTELNHLLAIADEAQKIILASHSTAVAERLSPLLRESWRVKRSLSTKVTDSKIDELYDHCMASGAIAGKLCGAGGGGFLLLIVPPDRRRSFMAAVGERRCVIFKMNFSGAEIVEIGHFRDGLMQEMGRSAASDWPVKIEDASEPSK